MKSFAFLTILVFCFLQFFGQATPSSQIPPSPQAYSLAKYGDIPVSLYTGVPNISIPLTSITTGDLNLNIDLSYHGSGFKVDEIASFVGLGWTLNFGGAITRVVHAKPEYVSSSGQLLPERTRMKFRAIGQSIDNLLSLNQLEAVSQGAIDAEPDEFYYNFNGRSGKFTFDSAKVAKFNKDEPLLIDWQFVSFDVSKFLIKDEVGNTYEFAEYEKTYNPGEQSFISAWYLSKMTSPKGKVITFEYINNYTTQYNRSYSRVLHQLHPTNTAITGPTYNVPFEGSGQQELQIKKIIYSNGYVQFDYKSQQRLDVLASAPRALEFVSVFTNSNNCTKKIKLTTSYFEANNGFRYDGSNPSNFEYLNYRLRLDAVQEMDGKSSLLSPPYSFTYLGDNNPSTDDVYTLPYRLSPAQDHWGYFNHSYNSHLIPGKGNEYLVTDDWYTEFMGDDNPPMSSNAPLTGGANRNVDTNAAKACMLSRITYPTGGYTDFSFRSNFTIGNMGGLHISKILSQPVTGNGKETSYAYSGYNSFDPMKYYFEYFEVNYTSGGQPVPVESVLQLFQIPNVHASQGTKIKYIAISTHPQVVLGPGSQIGFSHVIEKQTGNGTTESVFAGPSDFPDYLERDVFNEGSSAENDMVSQLYISEYVSNTDFPFSGGMSISGTSGGYGRWPYPENYSNDWKRGVLKARYTKSESNILLRKEEFTYSRKLLSTVEGFKLMRIKYGEYLYQKYCFPNARILETKKELTDFDPAGNNPLKTTIETFYDNPAHLQPTRIETTLSDESKSIVTSIYPLDYAAGTAFIDDLNNSHVLANPIEVVKYKEKDGVKSILSGSINKFKVGGKGIKEEILSMETISPVSMGSYKFSNKAMGVLPFSGANTSFSQDSRYASKLQYPRYDNVGNLLEVKATGNISQSYVWGYDQMYPIAEAAHAGSNEIFFSGFEDGTGWDSKTIIDRNKSHSGRASGRIDHVGSGEEISHMTSWLQISNGVATKYKFSGWIFSSGPGAEIYFFMKTASETGYYTLVNPVETVQTGQWVYLEKEYLVPANISLIGLRLDNNGTGSVWFDDIRLHPSRSQMKTYTYDPLVGLTSTADINNRFTYYYYDELNRLAFVKDHDGNILKKYCYNYNGQSENCTIHFSQLKSGIFSKNCADGGTSNSVVYTVPAEKYWSTVSPEIADQKAQDDVNANGQAYANSIGVCTYYSNLISDNYYSQNCGTGGTPQPYPVYIAAGAYSSTISKGHANSLAAAQAQGQANANGSCQVSIQINYSNSSSMKYVTFTNAQTSEQYYFSMSGSSSGILGVIPAGTYNIEFYDPYYNYAGYYVGCTNASGYGTTYVSGVQINSGCSNIYAY